MKNDSHNGGDMLTPDIAQSNSTPTIIPTLRIVIGLRTGDQSLHV